MGQSGHVDVTLRQLNTCVGPPSPGLYCLECLLHRSCNGLSLYGLQQGIRRSRRSRAYSNLPLHNRFPIGNQAHGRQL